MACVLWADRYSKVEVASVDEAASVGTIEGASMMTVRVLVDVRPGGGMRGGADLAYCNIRHLSTAGDRQIIGCDGERLRVLGGLR